LNNNVSLPKHQYAYLRTEFCNNLDEKHNGTIPCVVFGAESNPERALGFHVLREDGALVAQVPIHALCWKIDAPQQQVGELEAWDCFGYWLTVIEFRYLRERAFSYKHAGAEQQGRYLCTFDFIDNGFSDHPTQHKCWHFLALDNGNYALQPNNRCRVIDKSFTENEFTWDKPPAIQTNELTWYCEGDQPVGTKERGKSASSFEVPPRITTSSNP